MRVSGRRGWCVWVVVPCLAALCSAGSVVLSAQSGGRDGSASPSRAAWRQPFHDAPHYWELIGRVFAESAPRASQRAFRPLAGPAILAVAATPRAARDGVATATLATLAFDPASLVSRVRLVLHDVVQARASVVGADILIEQRRAVRVEAAQACVDARLAVLAPLQDARTRAIDACATQWRWTDWVSSARVPRSGGVGSLADGLAVRVHLASDGVVELAPATE